MVPPGSVAMVGEAGAEVFQGVVPKRIARDRIETEDLAGTGGKNGLVLQEDIDEIVAFEVRGPYLLAGGTVEGEDRSFDADEYQV